MYEIIIAIMIAIIILSILNYLYNKESREGMITTSCTGSPSFNNKNRETRFYDIATYDFI